MRFFLDKGCACLRSSSLLIRVWDLVMDTLTDRGWMMDAETLNGTPCGGCGSAAVVSIETPRGLAVHRCAACNKRAFQMGAWGHCQCETATKFAKLCGHCVCGASCNPFCFKTNAELREIN